MGKVCVEQSMGHLASHSLPSAYQLPLSSHTWLLVTVIIKEIPMCCRPCPRVSLDYPTLPPASPLAPAVGDLGQ